MRAFLFLLTIFLSFSLFGAGNWSTQKTAGALSVCYQSADQMYCAGSPSKKTTEKDLKFFLSAFLHFGDKNVTKDMLIHPGLKRLVKSSRPGEGKRILKGVYDFLTREAKRKQISLSTGKTKESQQVMAQCDQKTALDEMQWYKFVEVSAEQAGCSPDEVISVNLSITNSLKKDLVIKRDQIELKIMSTGNMLMTVGSIETDKVVVKPGKTNTYEVKIQMTGAMDPAMGYQLVPIIKNVNIMKEKPFVRCKK